MLELDAEAKQAGIVVVNEVGLSPGIDHLYAVKTINEVHAKGGKVCASFKLYPNVLNYASQIKEFHSYCGSLPAPESDNLLVHKVSSSSPNELLELFESASFLRDGKQVDISRNDLIEHVQPCHVSPAFAFVAYPRGNSVTLRELYDIPEADTVVRGTLCYQGFPEFLVALQKIGFLDAEEKEWLTDDLTWAEVTQKVVSAASADEAWVAYRSSAAS